MKLAGFVALLVLVFGVAVAAGDVVGPDREPQGGMHVANPIRGLSVSEGELSLELTRTASELAFSIREGGEAVREFDLEHEKRMHVIVVRRDGTGFQHLHPTMDADGTWRTPLSLREPGVYRVFADFKRDETAYTLAADVNVDGAATYAPFPPPSSVDTVDGYRVELRADGSALDFEITRDGAPVQTEQYLGAGGHLVALREGDLAFLHVHPEDDGVAFESELEPGTRYRLYLQFQHEGVVHTAEFAR